jgi:hypothetical protein
MPVRQMVDSELALVWEQAPDRTLATAGLDTTHEKGTYGCPFLVNAPLGAFEHAPLTAAGRRRLHAKANAVRSPSAMV